MDLLGSTPQGDTPSTVKDPNGTVTNQEKPLRKTKKAEKRRDQSSKRTKERCQRDGIKGCSRNCSETEKALSLREYVPQPALQVPSYRSRDY
jgi:hypothetical protein